MPTPYDATWEKLNLDLTAHEGLLQVLGTFCVFVPEELGLAAGAICVGLCAGAAIGKESAEKILPRTPAP
jgi:benzoyl-CoA reductase/2-hydroxyglutaryl-CoA dehydratase subunit BcrC/BadD/HgdB